MTKRRVVIYSCLDYEIVCDGLWHYIVPADGGKVLNDGSCDCEYSDEIPA